MSENRMCRWHTQCCDPTFEYKAIEIIDYNTKVRREVKVPECKKCGKSPPLEQLIPKLAKDWQKNPLPEDEKIGEMDLHWPESVFGKRKPLAQQRPTVSSGQNDDIEVEVDGSTLALKMVDYTPISESQLRLMRLSPQEGNNPVCADLQAYGDDNMPEFEALSYSLGGESRVTTPSNPIYIGMHKDIMLLTETCEAMLKFLSPHPGESSRLLWFDFLCINQSDFAERDRQLPKMRSIYSGCTRVIVYLGNNMVERLDTKHHRYRCWLHEIDRTLDSKSGSTALTLKDILNRNYFQRTWIIQEILLAENVIIPIRKFDFRASVVALNLLRHYAPQWKWERTATPWMQYVGQASVNTSNLYEALRLTWGSKVTDQRDRIFGVLGLVPDDPEFKPDSSLSWISTFIGTCAHLIKRGHTELLLKGIGMKAKDPVMQLTWLPDLTDLTIWNPPDASPLELLRNFRLRYFVIDKDDPFEFKTAFPKCRIDAICMRTGLEDNLPLVPKIQTISLSSSSGALCLKLSHLVTLTKISVPQPIPALWYDENSYGSLKAFKIGDERVWLMVSTLEGPLDRLQASDELYLHIGRSNECAILFALRYYAQDSTYKMLFSCVCIDALLFTTEEAIQDRCTPSIDIGANLEGKVHEPGVRSIHQWLRPSFGRSLSSVLVEQCDNTSEVQLPYNAPFLQLGYPYEEALRFYGFYAYARTPYHEHKGYLGLKYEVKENEILPLSQALLNDEKLLKEGQTSQFLVEFQSFFEKRNPGNTITLNGDILLVSGNLPEFYQDEDSIVSQVRDKRSASPREFQTCLSEELFPDWAKDSICKPNIFKVPRWKPQTIEVFTENLRHDILRNSIYYRQLKSLSGFRDKTPGKNTETEIRELRNNQDSKLDNIYADMEWPCEQSVIDALGLVGKVKDVCIQ